MSPELQESPEFKRLSKQLCGALRDSINAHGPISKALLTSAVKRQATQLIASGLVAGPKLGLSRRSEIDPWLL